jgi:uncharacterized OsmC-like protein
MTTLSIDWIGDLKFKNSDGNPQIELHSSTPGVTSPMQALAYSVMACMGMDVVHVVRKGRHDLRAMKVTFEGERATDYPKRFVSMTLHWHITGTVPAKVVERAIEMSRQKYCSVWNSIRPDVALVTGFSLYEP